MNTAATFHPPSSRPPTTLNARDQPPVEISHQKVSGLTGAIHLDTFRAIYNTERTHRALPSATTPAQAYLARPKAHPTGQATTHFRIRHDTVDQFGKLTLRHGSRLHHLGIGRTHAHTPALILVAAHTVTVISKTSHHVLSSHTIDPDKNYWRNQNKNPGRWPGNL